VIESHPMKSLNVNWNMTRGICCMFLLVVWLVVLITCCWWELVAFFCSHWILVIDFCFKIGLFHIAIYLFKIGLGDELIE